MSLIIELCINDILFPRFAECKCELDRCNVNEPFCDDFNCLLNLYLFYSYNSDL